MYSSTDILAALERGDITISDFDESRLQPNSYDVLLGGYFFAVNWDKDGPLFEGPIHLLDGQCIELPGGGTMLGMTRDVIGTFGKVIAKMYAKSTMARLGIMVCGDAGLGDIGYHNHWTMELRGHTTGAMPYLVVGQAIAQLVFFETKSEPVAAYQGQYNEADWPLCMIPKKYRHRIIAPETYPLPLETNYKGGKISLK